MFRRGIFIAYYQLKELFTFNFYIYLGMRAQRYLYMQNKPHNHYIFIQVYLKRDVGLVD